MSNSLSTILEKSLAGGSLERKELIYLLSLEDDASLNQLFRAAREMRSRFFDNKIFLYGFLYISTYCRNNCTFCYYRTENSSSLRYRKDESQILDAARGLAESGVHLVDLTMGEDPKLFDPGFLGFESLYDLVRKVKNSTSLPLMISPGVVPLTVMEKLAQAGADWYACYQETHNPRLFARLRPGQDYEGRLQGKIDAHRTGLLCEEGVLAGVGETPEDMAATLNAMATLDADQVRAMNFVPGPGIPIHGLLTGDRTRELVYIAVMRLVFPDLLVPATLDVAGLWGLKSRLMAGANVVTSLVPPGRGLAGVAQSSLDIDEDRRSVEPVKRILQACGLQKAEQDDYSSWLASRKKRLQSLTPGEKQ